MFFGTMDTYKEPLAAAVNIQILSEASNNLLSSLPSAFGIGQFEPVGPGKKPAHDTTRMYDKPTATGGVRGSCFLCFVVRSYSCRLDLKGNELPERLQKYTTLRPCSSRLLWLLSFAVTAWLIISRNAGVVKDIRLFIGSKLWSTREDVVWER